MLIINLPFASPSRYWNIVKKILQHSQESWRKYVKKRKVATSRWHDDNKNDLASRQTQQNSQTIHHSLPPTPNSQLITTINTARKTLLESLSKKWSACQNSNSVNVLGALISRCRTKFRNQLMLNTRQDIVQDITPINGNAATSRSLRVY